MAGFGIDISNVDQDLENAFASTSGAVAVPSVSERDAPLVSDPDANEFLMETIKKSSEAQQRANNNALTRLDSQASMLQQSKDLMQSANDRLLKIQANPFSDLLGLFDDTYDESSARRDIALARNQFTIANESNSVAAARDKLMVENAKLPLEMMETIQKVKKGQLELDAKELDIISKNQGIQQEFIRVRREMVTPAQISHAVQTGNYTRTITPDFAKQYAHDHEMMTLNLNSARMAEQEGKLDFAQKFKDQAMSTASEGWLSYQITQMDEAGKNVMDLGNGAVVSRQQLETTLVSRQKENFDNQKVLSQIMADSKTNMSGSAAVASAAAATAVSYKGGVSTVIDNANGQRMSNQDLLPPDDSFDSISAAHAGTFDFRAALPAQIAPAVEELWMKKAELNDKIANKEPTTTAEFIHIGDLTKEVEKVTAAYNKSFVESKAKRYQPAYQQAVNNNNVITENRQAAMIIAADGFTPQQFNGNVAIKKGFETALLNYGESVGIIETNDGKSETEKRIDVDMLLAKFQNGDFDSTDFNEVSKAVNKNVGGTGPNVRQQIVNESLTPIVYNSVKAMAAQVPELRDTFFSPTGELTKSALNSKGQLDLAKIIRNLTQVSFQQTGDAKQYPNMLTAAFNQSLEGMRPSMDDMKTLTEKSFMFMAFPNDKLSNVVDKAFNDLIRPQVRQAAFDVTNNIAEDEVQAVQDLSLTSMVRPGETVSNALVTGAKLHSTTTGGIQNIMNAVRSVFDSDEEK